MNTRDPDQEPLAGDLLGDEPVLSLEDLCQHCTLEVAHAVSLVREGVIEPDGERPTEWRFSVVSVRRARVAVRLQRDLGVNLAGAALALDLLDRIAELERGRG